jgi:hypothetical protein
MHVRRSRATGRQKAVGKMPPAIFLQQCASKGNRNESQILIGACEVPSAPRVRGLCPLTVVKRRLELQRANAQKPGLKGQSKLKAPGRITKSQLLCPKGRKMPWRLPRGVSLFLLLSSEREASRVVSSDFVDCGFASRKRRSTKPHETTRKAPAGSR